MIEIIGFLFILILGTLSHFFYEWFGHKKIFALLFSVNESVWEHIKLALGPTFLWIIIEVPFLGINGSFLFAKLICLLTLIIFIPVFFYIYLAIFKKSILFLNILEFIISIALGQFFSYLAYNYLVVSTQINYISIGFIFAIIILYLLFTFKPPRVFLFMDPINKKYGIDAHLDFDKNKK